MSRQRSRRKFTASPVLPLKVQLIDAKYAVVMLPKAEGAVRLYTWRLVAVNNENVAAIRGVYIRNARIISAVLPLNYNAVKIRILLVCKSIVQISKDEINLPHKSVLLCGIFSRVVGASKLLRHVIFVTQALWDNCSQVYFQSYTGSS